MWVTPDEVLAAWIGDDEPDDVAKIEYWIGAAERKLRRAVPTLAGRITAGETDLIESAKDVLIAVVTRVFRNPEGLRSVSRTDGPFNGSETYGGENPGALEFTAVELASLAPESVAGLKKKAFSVSLIPAASPYRG